MHVSNVLPSAELWLEPMTLTAIFRRVCGCHAVGPAQLEELSPAERAVMGPPYANRLDRPVVVLTSPSSEANDSDRSVEPSTARDASEEAVPVATVPAPRNPAKKAFDKSVFNTSYF